MRILVNKTFTEEDVIRVKDKVGRVKLGYVKKELLVGHARWPFKPKQELFETKCESHPKGITAFYIKHCVNFKSTLESREIDGWSSVLGLIKAFDRGDRSFSIPNHVLEVLQLIEDGIDD